MNPLYFGDPDKPLYGVYHPPVGSEYQAEAYLICGPIGHEFTKAYSAIKNLALALSAKGIHVLRFSYTGLGDSASPSEAFSVEQSLEDIRVAMDELRDMSACRHISLIGVRYGALMALEIATQHKMNRLVLWEPVLSGSSYIDQTRLLHKQMLNDPNRFDLRIQKNEYGEEQLLGHPYSERVQNSMANLNHEDFIAIKAQYLSIHTSDASLAEIGAHSASASGGSNLQIKVLLNQDHGDWKNLDVEIMYLPNQAIINIVDELI